ncbi:MAG: ATP-dependent zinc metalloprotease FtsH [Bdellovibrionota bacterium]
MGFIDVDGGDGVSIHQPFFPANSRKDFVFYLSGKGRAGLVESVSVYEDRIEGDYVPSVSSSSTTDSAEETSSSRFVTDWLGTGEGLTEFLEENNVKNFDTVSEEKTNFWKQLFISGFPLVLMIFFFLILFRQIQVGGGKALNFGKSKAKMMTEDQTKITFKDVAGVDEAKEELTEIIDFLKDPKKYQKLGVRIPKGVLLVGPPGTGKTLLAKAVAGEAGVPFFSISGSDFVEMFVGVGASRVRDLFEQGKKNAPCIIFIDEIDAVGRHRGAGLGGGHDEREQTLNQLLVEMDGFETHESVILIAATNRVDVLDPALMRPGRFDRHVMVPRPDVLGREQILKVHGGKVPISKDVDFAVIARGTVGFSGADLENLINEAALITARENREEVTSKDLENAKDKLMLGKERKSMVMSEEEKEVTAYHEAGHTLVAKLSPDADPVHKVTIVPRGMALGVTHQLPEKDKYTMKKNEAETMIAILMGGRLAEEIVFGKITSGAANDIERATDLARKMVCEWGMSEELGPLAFKNQGDQIFLAREVSSPNHISEQTSPLIDQEIKKLVMKNYQRAKELLEKHRKALDGIAKALLEKEILHAHDIDDILQSAMA